MMSDDLDELDAALRRAMAALDGEAPAGYFEALPGRTLARLDDPALGTAIGELPEEPARPLRAVQDRQSPADGDDDDAVFSSQIMAAVELSELPEPDEQGGGPRGDRVSASSVGMRAVEPAAAAAAARPASAAPVPSSIAAAPVEVPASAAASMALAGSPGRRRSRRVAAAIVGIGGIGLAAIAVSYLRVGDRAPRSASSMASSSERTAPASAPVAGSPGAGGGAAGSAVATPAMPGAGSSLAPDPAPEPVGKSAGGGGKSPGNGKTVSKTGGAKPPARVAPGATGKGSSDELGVPGKKLKSSKPRPDRTSLSGDDIERAMTAVAGQARACFAGIRGTAPLRLTVAPSGRIARVTVTGPFAGTPAGACLERAVQAATFPPWSGVPQSFDYSYLLSD